LGLVFCVFFVYIFIVIASAVSCRWNDV